MLALPPNRSKGKLPNLNYEETYMKKLHVERIRKLHTDLLENTYPEMTKYPFEDPQFYGHWLSQHYYYTSHTTRMLCAAAARMGMNYDNLHTRFLKHASEERHHEKLILKDLKALNKDINEFPELPVTAQLYQSQYYLIEHKSPVSLLGAALFLEGLSYKVGPSIYEITKKHHGGKASNFIRVHAMVDQDHIIEAQEALDLIEPNDLPHVEWSLKQTASIYQGILNEVLNAHQQVRKPSRLNRAA
jgi:thiaminase